MKKRALSLLMSLVMVISLLPATARAAETSQITVQMTVYDQGQPAKDKDDKAMLLRSVTVSDLDGNGKYTIDEAFQAAHSSLCPAGAAGYVNASGWVTALWGNDSGNYGYYVNDVSAWSVSDELEAGDRLTAFVYYDQTDYSDRYAYFDKQSVTVPVNTEQTFTLLWSGYDANWSPVTGAAVVGAPLGVFNGETGVYAASDAIKGELIYGDIYMKPSIGLDGKVKCSFTQTGTYYLTAEYNNSGYKTYNDDNTVRYNYLVPPLCVVTVLSAQDYAAYENRLVLDEAKKQLTWASLSAQPKNAVTDAPALCSELTANGKKVAVTWASSSAALSVSEYGGAWSAWVDRPAAQDADVTLTATLTYTPDGGDPLTDTVVFQLTVKAEGVSSDKTAVVDFKTLMDGIAGTYTASTDAWTVLDMAGYGRNIKGEDYGDSSAVAALLARCALGEETSIPEELKTFDVNGAYAIYNLPYVLLGYDAAQAQEDDTFTNTRAGMKTVLVNYLNSLADNYAGVDEAAPVLTALAPYYGKGDEQLDAAVNAGLTWLSAQQNSDGAFSYYGTSNANSTAMAVVALSALGVDAHRDARFIKNEHSALEGLLTFALAGNDGFGYKGNVTKNTMATEQGFRALVSYARFAERNGAYNIYLEAQVGQDAPADPGLSATVRPSRPDAGDDGDEDNAQITVTVTVKGVDKTWLKERVSVSTGSSAYDAILSALEENGYSLEGDENYISAIIAPDGSSLGELDYGDNSGWLYKVNGKLGSVPVGEYTMNRNSSVTLYYTIDWTKDPDAGAMAQPEQPAQQPEAGIDGFTDLNADGWYITAVSYMLEKGLMTGTGEDTFSPEESTTRAQLITILWNLAGCPQADRAADYTDTDPAAWYAQALDWAAQIGLVSGYEDGSFGPDDQITREQFAAILYRYAQSLGEGFIGSWYFSLEYADVAQISVWADEAIHWCVMKGILSGTEEDAISPAQYATRAQMAVMLMQFCLRGK